MSLSFGDLKYSLEKIEATDLTNFLKLFIAVLSPIFKLFIHEIGHHSISKHSDCSDHLLQGRQLECVSCISFINKVCFISFNSRMDT